jgi:hypothetical protein
MTLIKLLTRRDFLGTSAQAAAAALLVNPLRASGLLSAVSPWEADGYDHKVVVRVYDPAVASTYTFGSQYYWRKFNTTKLQSMLETGIMELSNTATPQDAWARILPGVSAASKIVAKVNLNNTRREWQSAALNSSPAMMIALTKSLNKASVQNGNITFLDCSRPFPDEMKNELQVQCPGVQCAGGAQAGSSATQDMPYGGPYVIPHLVMEADFLLNCHLMKKHDGGHTGAIKNLFGMNADGKVSFAHRDPRWMDGNQCKSIITHPEIKKRLKLCINEAILAAKTPDTLDAYQFTDLFPDGRPSSLFLSRNPFFQDVVEWDFVRAECSGFSCRSGDTITWLKNCAGSLPNWTAAAVESGVQVNGGAGLPPKDMSYNPALLQYISRTVGSASARPHSGYQQGNSGGRVRS